METEPNLHKYPSNRSIVIEIHSLVERADARERERERERERDRQTDRQTKG